MSASFDAWYASLPILDIRYEETFVSPQVDAHWYNYMQALRSCMEAIGKEGTLSPEEYLKHYAADYEAAMITSCADEMQQMVMACRVSFNIAAANLILNLALARNYAGKGYELPMLQPDIVYRRQLYETARAEMVYITESVGAISRGTTPPAPPLGMSTLLTAFVESA